jgi:hypothetical protein
MGRRAFEPWILAGLNSIMSQIEFSCLCEPGEMGVFHMQKQLVSWILIRHEYFFHVINLLIRLDNVADKCVTNVLSF